MNSQPYAHIHVLFLAAKESSVRTDARILRDLGVRRMTFAPTAHQAMLLLRAEDSSFDFILCDSSPGRSELMAFLRSLAKDPQLAGKPLLTLTSEGALTATLSGAGVPVLERPYAAGQLEKALARRQSHAPLMEDALPAAPPPPRARVRAVRAVTVSDWFAAGMEHMGKGRYSEAERAMREVIRRRSEHMEAHVVLARIRYAQGDKTGMHRLLLRAAVLARREGNVEKASAIIALLPSRWREGNLFMHEAMVSLEEKMYQDAAKAFLDLWESSPGQPLLGVLARACQFTEDPEGSLAALSSAFDRLGLHATATRVRARFLRHSQAVAADGRSGWLDRFPRLKEMAGVASYAAWAWRQAS